LSFNGGTEIADGYFEDEFSVVWNRTGIDKDIGIVEKYLLEDADAPVFVLPAVDPADIEKKSRAFLAKQTDTHSCGNIEAILPDLIEIGLDVYQTVQPEIYDLKNLKNKFGDNLCFYGAISTQRTLAFVKPEELKSIIKETSKTLNRKGGYICAPTHQVQADVPCENILAMVESFKKL
jgi:uroporphyrinogen-III decarboxylase